MRIKRSQRTGRCGRVALALCRTLAVAIVLIAPAVASAAADRCGDVPAALGGLRPPRGEARAGGAVVGGDGKARDLSAFRGTGLVLNFWATWCPPCVEEMPALDRLEQQLAGSAVRVVAVSEDVEGAAVVEPFFQRNGIRHLGVYLDPGGRLAAGLGLGGLPTTVLVSADGREAGRIVGVAAWDDPAVAAFLNRCLAPPG